MWIYIVVTIVILFLIYIVITYNSLTKIRNRVEEGFSTMDVYLKKRWDLIPNLVEVVKGYANHEKTTLKEIVELRNSVYDNMNTNDKVDTNNKLSQQITKLMVLAESYPNLKASDNFKSLSNQLTKIEDDIANSRKYYNGIVRIMNNKVEMFPSNIVAKMLGFKTYKMFETKKDERDSIRIEL